MSRRMKLTLGQQIDDTFLPSTHPSTKEDMKQLEQRFDLMLYNETALENGLCSKRRRIYDDLFDELIRITKVHCLDRGLLLERVKDEYTQWLNTYNELYSSSMAYGMRQYLYKMEEKKRLEETINRLENECEQLRDEVKIESDRLQAIREKAMQKHANETKEQRLLRSNVRFLEGAKKKVQNELENTLNQMLTSSIFLVDPMDYEKKTT